MERVTSARADHRLDVAARWLAARPAGESVLVIGASWEAASELIRRVAGGTGTGFGWHRTTLGRLARELAKLPLAARGLAVAGELAIEALCARGLRTTNWSISPGMPRALARTLGELRMAGVDPVADVDRDLAIAHRALADQLAAARLADRAMIYELASAVAAGERHPLLDLPTVVLDVAARSVRERTLLDQVVARSRDALIVEPAGDAAALDRDEWTTLERTQQRLFGARSRPTGTTSEGSPGPRWTPNDGSVQIIAAAGEHRECVELARAVLGHAERGIAFDRMAILVRAPTIYRVHLEEALTRAAIPAHFEQGTVLPDPAGRAFLALLACAGEKLSARRFAEYLSLGELPATLAGAPPPPIAGDAWWTESVDDDFAIGPPITREPPSDPNHTTAQPLTAPWRWEQLLVDSAVIGGRDRWQRRLAGLAAALALDGGERDAARRDRTLAELAELQAFALPVIDDLAALPVVATWGEWLDRLARLASRTLANPERVLAVLSSLTPLAELGDITLGEVRRVLHSRLAELVVVPRTRRHGRLWVAPIEAARGLAFDVVFVPGLAERIFPPRIIEDPLLLDHRRASYGRALATRESRFADEREALRIALGCARIAAVLSYPTVDLEHGRPRVPSFYALEVIAAATGQLPRFEDLAVKPAETDDAPRLWIDDSEHDLALLAPLLAPPSGGSAGAAAYLLAANPHLARALRTRARRWTVRAWKPADGLIVSNQAGRAALAAHAPNTRSFSATALEQLAACPYRFALRTIVGLEPREVPEPIEVLGPLERGSLIHEVYFELFSELRTAGWVPVTHQRLAAIYERADRTLDRVAARYHDDLAPAIERVWDEGITAIRADIREWLRRVADQPEWDPIHGELAFGTTRSPRDPASSDHPVAILPTLMLRGSIDVVERDIGGALRAIDFKTGTSRARSGLGNRTRALVIDGGQRLQPVLYALALERLFPGARVIGGRLAYCTSRGGFTTIDVPLDDDARRAAELVAATLASCFADGFFPAAPSEGACRYCDFRAVCGPYEEARARTKASESLATIARLRSTR